MMLRTNELRAARNAGMQEPKCPINWKRELRVGEDYTMESLILAQDER
jgi:hypothetical protein